ncbi:retrotransposon protein, putative, ty1-copia subclass [Tanacetum coccineum]|uniref:Retrotransposon protein, putative, ty1-copia subclass n=1 Tax=Tanacetum coccineum TaxID=301880 RepID=A0ABQ4YU83_9ASTR
MTTTIVNNLVFRGFYEKQKLTGPNFIDWYRYLLLSAKDKLNYLEHPIPAAPVPNFARQQVPPEPLAAHAAWVKGQKEIDVLMLMTMEIDLQWNLENLGAYDMLQELKTLFSQQAEQELLQTVREFHACKKEEGQSVSLYVLKMKSYIDHLERVGYPVSLSLAVSFILVSLRKEYDTFVQNYNMHGIGKTVNELHDMLKLHEQTLPKKDAPTLHAIRAGKVQKKIYKNKKLQLAARGNNHRKGTELSLISSRVAEEQEAISRSYHFRGSRKLKPEALSLYVGEGHRAAVEAIGSYHLCLPSRLVLVLHNSNYAPSITRGIILVSCLYDDGFINHFDENNTISVSMNNLVYFSAIPRNGIYEIDLSNSNINDCSMYSVSNKRAKTNLDSSLLWHCRLRHISKKHIEKLQHDGLPNSTHNQSFEKCVSCMSRKMAQKPYTHQVERAKHLLGLLHTDEVENQLGKTIKSLRSNRGGEYMSQEFLDHLKEHGIIAHRTPTYMPQHNGVSERRNRTLLDMVRSMISQITLPKSFWDYALESAARILNMVSTKKVEKTPYEIWHGQAPKLSYLNYGVVRHFLMTQEASGSLEDLEIIQEEDTHPSINTSLDHDKDDQEIDEPQSDINPIHAMNVEMQCTKDNKVLDLVDLCPDGKTVGSKWLFKKKTDMDGTVHTYKARLVAKGFTQTYGVDYEEIFSIVADIRAIRVLVAIAAFYDYEIWQMDVKTAFLNGHLSEEVYMVKPEGLINPKYPNRKFRFTQNRDEPCVNKKASESNVTFLILYVDDILIMRNHIPMLQDVKSYLRRCFATKDLGEASYILEIKNYKDRSKRLIGLCQSAYIDKILKRFYMENSKPGSIPVQEKLKLSKSQGASTPNEVKRMQNISYALAVGSIMYVVRCTRPDVAFAQIITSIFQQNPGDLHWTTLRVSCYTDAGYLTNDDDLNYQTRYVFILNGGVVDWKSIKKSIFATSSAEAEYIAAYDASKEVVWIRKFISGLGVVPTNEEPITMYCDNTGAINIANESGITKGARHYRAKVHYLREVIEFGDVKIEKVYTDDNLADPFTKALPLAKHNILRI